MLQPPPSLWWSAVAPVTPRPALTNDLVVDVAIVGAGFTGLWTARELLRRQPDLRIAILDSSVAGFGASGRNGGWVSALFPLSDDVVERRHGADALAHQRRVLRDAVTDLGDAVAGDGIDAHFHQGGTLTFARNDVQRRRLHDAVVEAHASGENTEDLQWLDIDELRGVGLVEGALGATFSPHCARIQPALLVRGLADVVEDLGAALYEDTAVTRIEPGTRTRPARVVTVGGTVHASFVVRATEGFTPALTGHRRDVVPVYSLMIATDPLPASFWSAHGFGDYPTFADDRNMIIYGQRTADDRLAFGGRGAPYHFGSSVEPQFDANAKVFKDLEVTLHELFPDLDAGVAHQWGGPLALPRDREPRVAIDFDTGLASAGGYTGDGVTLTYVCANALADLITDRDTPTRYTELPFVQRELRRWEVEPLRWLGINTGLVLASGADRQEAQGQDRGRASRWLERLMGA